jgi:hypothetical protein
MSMEFHGAVLKSLRVEGVQSGLILSAQLFVELENRAKDEATEVVLRFRSLPSAIWKFVANVGSREIFSQVVEKKPRSRRLRQRGEFQSDSSHVRTTGQQLFLNWLLGFSIHRSGVMFASGLTRI